MIRKIANELMNVIESFYSKYNDLDEKLTAINLSKDKWSLKQIIGHLIDSTSNNHQRFIRFQIDPKLNFPDYNKDEWLEVTDYNNIHFKDLLNLFFFLQQANFKYNQKNRYRFSA